VKTECAVNLSPFVGVDLNLWPTVYIAVIVKGIKSLTLHCCTKLASMRSQTQDLTPGTLCLSHLTTGSVGHFKTSWTQKQLKTHYFTRDSFYILWCMSKLSKAGNITLRILFTISHLSCVCCVDSFRDHMCLRCVTYSGKCENTCVCAISRVSVRSHVYMCMCYVTCCCKCEITCVCVLFHV